MQGLFSRIVYVANRLRGGYLQELHDYILRFPFKAARAEFQCRWKKPCQVSVHSFPYDLVPIAP